MSEPVFMHVNVNPSQAYREMIPHILDLRNQVVQSVKQAAFSAQNCTMSRSTVNEIAQNILQQGLEKFQAELNQTYTREPWALFADMIITTAKEDSFEKYTPLFKEIVDILLMKTPKEEESIKQRGIHDQTALNWDFE